MYVYFPEPIQLSHPVPMATRFEGRIGSGVKEQILDLAGDNSSDFFDQVDHGAEMVYNLTVLIVCKFILAPTT